VHKTTKIAALAAIAGLLSACGGSNGPVQSLPQQKTPAIPAPAPAITSGTVVQSEGMTLHLVPTKSNVASMVRRGAASKTARSMAMVSGTLNWNGGPVQHNPKMYIVFWGSKWSTSNSVYKTTVNFYSGLNGSQWNGTVSQYSDNVQNITNDATVAGTWIDTASVPLHPTTSAVGSEAKRAVSHFGFKGTDANYIVAIEQGHDPSGFATQWCAWHSSESGTSGTISFTNLPYMPDAGANCGAGSVNYPGTNDGVSIVGGHEEAETETDPQPSSGWTDSSGNEIGDLCAWQNLQNTGFSTGTFPTQPLWSDNANGCVQ
jgi:serine protease